jgi:enoyl-CoA hydratase / 3-hydroxyacyl-CoA dehydrogenase
MATQPLRKAAVIGAGSMGHGIAQLLIMTGTDVTIVDVNDEILAKARQKIQWSIEKFVEKRTVNKADADAAMGRLHTTTNMNGAFKDADLIIEAAPENLEMKKKLFAQMEQAAPKHTIFGSNTSTLSITELGKVTSRPDKVVGLHFFNPPQMMPLLEIIKGAQTSEETTKFALDLAKKLGKTPVLVKKDVRGFIVNGILAAVFNEAFWAVERKEATRDEIDAAMKYQAGFPMGIFELADFVGLDILNSVAREMEDALGARAKACPIYQPLVKAGKLGQKTGEGFYSWSTGRPRIPFELADKFDPNRLYTMAANAAAWLVHDDVASPADIDTAMKFGTGWPSGPCELADKMGIDAVVKNLNELHAKHPEPMYEPCPLLLEYVKNGWLGRKASRGFHKYK